MAVDILEAAAVRIGSILPLCMRLAPTGRDRRVSDRIHRLTAILRNDEQHFARRMRIRNPLGRELTELVVRQQHYKGRVGEPMHAAVSSVNLGWFTAPIAS